MDEVSEFFGQESSFGLDTVKHKWSIMTLEGTMEAKLDDWIIKGIAGEFKRGLNENFNNPQDVVDETPKDEAKDTFEHNGILQRVKEDFNNIFDNNLPPLG